MCQEAIVNADEIACILIEAAIRFGRADGEFLSLSTRHFEHDFASVSLEEIESTRLSSS